MPLRAVGWMSALVLAGEPRHPRSNVAHDRLESRVSILPEVHEAAVVLARLGAVAAAFVKLPQPRQARRESAPEVVDVLGRSWVGRHLLVGRQRRIGLPGLLVRQPQLPVAAGPAQRALFDRLAQGADRLLPLPLSQGDIASQIWPLLVADFVGATR